MSDGGRQEETTASGIAHGQGAEILGFRPHPEPARVLEFVKGSRGSAEKEELQGA